MGREEEVEEEILIPKNPYNGKLIIIIRIG